MSLSRIGLVLDFAGAALIGSSSYFGIGSGFGALVWVNRTWAALYALGWILLLAGFALQFVADRQRAPIESRPSTTDALASPQPWIIGGVAVISAAFLLVSAVGHEKVEATASVATLVLTFVLAWATYNYVGLTRKLAETAAIQAESILRQRDAAINEAVSVARRLGLFLVNIPDTDADPDWRFASLPIGPLDELDTFLALAIQGGPKAKLHADYAAKKLLIINEMLRQAVESERIPGFEPHTRNWWEDLWNERDAATVQIDNFLHAIGRRRSATNLSMRSQRT